MQDNSVFNNTIKNNKKMDEKMLYLTFYHQVLLQKRLLFYSFQKGKIIYYQELPFYIEMEEDTHKMKVATKENMFKNN